MRNRVICLVLSLSLTVIVVAPASAIGPAVSVDDGSDNVGWLFDLWHYVVEWVDPAGHPEPTSAWAAERGSNDPNGGASTAQTCDLCDEGGGNDPNGG